MEQKPLHKFAKFGLRALLFIFISAMIVIGLIVTYLFIADKFYDEEKNHSTSSRSAHSHLLTIKYEESLRPLGSGK
ncbi:hypothetical protein [Halobacillus hunanensis]|uniref:hypothetical protein n=1 Tax=Halobacillus hunanensis TaxID=578214 RepID=UPI0009A64777|nr:hypothetical protein [Halobacillus hunanensis]